MRKAFSVNSAKFRKRLKQQQQEQQREVVVEVSLLNLISYTLSMPVATVGVVTPMILRVSYIYGYIRK